MIEQEESNLRSTLQLHSSTRLQAAAKLTYLGQDMSENFDLCLSGMLEQ